MVRFAGGLVRKALLPLDLDDAAGWLGSAWESCRHLTAEDVDVILTTGGPFTAFALAERLSRRLACPYVLDYRDLWTGNPHRSRPVRPAHTREEQRLVAGATAITTVSESLASVLDQRFCIGSKLHVITNGYDAEDMARVEPHKFDHFAVVYTGDFYPPRSVTPLMRALKRLEARDAGSRPWLFHYFGGRSDHVKEEAARFGVHDRVVVHGSVPRDEALSAVRGANVAAVITSDSDTGTLTERGIVTGKLYEALGLGTPILLIAPDGSDAQRILCQCRAGGHFVGSDAQGISAFLEAALRGTRPGGGDPTPYSWKTIAQRLDDLLNNAPYTSPARHDDNRESPCTELDRRVFY
jgi:glycosyltransferase involved in cell wall biosynthesis